MRNGCFVVLFAVEQDVVYVFVLGRNAIGYNGECLAFGQMKHNLWHLWSTEYILATDRVHRIETHCREHVPCRHLSAVVVAAESVNGGVVLCVENLAYEFLRARWSTC